MLKTLFSKMFCAYLAVSVAVLTLFGFFSASIFREHYITEIRTELIKESNAINRIVIEEYIDKQQYPIAREKLHAIARQYGALLQISFSSNDFGSSNIVDKEYLDLWQFMLDVDISGLNEKVLAGQEFYCCEFDIAGETAPVRTISIGRPLQSGDGKRMGTLTIHYNMNGIYESLNKLYLDVFVLVLVAVLISLLFAFIISKYITNPVSKIRRAVAEFAKGNFERRIEKNGRDELGELGRSFNSMAEELAVLERTRRDFVANVSHELRSPLTSIRGFLEAMDDGTISESEHHKYIGIVLDETRRMTGMVNDLLDIARIESGQYKLNRTVFDINDLIGRVLLTFEARILESKLDIDVRIADESIYVHADRDRIGQVLHNLIDNAIKFAKQEGGIVRIIAEPTKQDVAVSVCDNGCGISQEDLKHIFERFYKAEKAHTHAKGSGTGLGLSIVKLIITQHGGEISAESDANGTVFTFRLKRVSSPKLSSTTT